MCNETLLGNNQYTKYDKLIYVPDAKFTASLMVFSCAFEAPEATVLSDRAGVDPPNRPDS